MIFARLTAGLTAGQTEGAWCMSYDIQSQSKVERKFSNQSKVKLLKQVAAVKLCLLQCEYTCQFEFEQICVQFKLLELVLNAKL